jgi:hypothetical protein
MFVVCTRIKNYGYMKLNTAVGKNRYERKIMKEYYKTAIGEIFYIIHTVHFH